MVSLTYLPPQQFQNEMQATVKVEVVVTNKKALRALVAAAEELAGLEEDFPYRPEIKRAQRALRYLAKHLELATQ